MRELLLRLLVLSVFVESLGIGPASVGRILAVVGLYASLLVVLSRSQTTLLPEPAIGVAVVGLGLWVFLSSIWASSFVGWASAMGQMALALCYFFSYVVLLESREQMRRLMVWYVYGAVAVAFVGLGQTGLTSRAVGLQGDPNMYALYELAAIPIAASLASISTGRHRRRWLLVVVLLVAAVLAAQSRGGLLATFGLLVFLLWTGEFGGRFAVRPRLTALVGSGTLFAVVFGAYLAIPRFHAEDVSANRGTGRLDIWHAAWAGWEEHPVLGLGAGNFIKQSDRLLSSTPGVELDPYSVLFDGIKVHNAYLEPWVELGPIGLGLYVGVLLTVGVVLFRVYRNEPSGVLRALFPMLLAFATATIFLSAINNKLLWMLAGLAAAYPYLPERKSSYFTHTSELEVT